MPLAFLQSLAQLIFDIIFAPIWWYTSGLVKFLRWALFFEKDRFQKVGVYVWIRNIFVPMYGQYSREGRIISFFMRLVQIIARLGFMAVYTMIVLALILVYLVLPIFVAYQLYLQIF